MLVSSKSFVLGAQGRLWSFLMLCLGLSMMLSAPVQAAPESFAPMVKKVSPSVVKIVVERGVKKGEDGQMQAPELQKGLEDFLRQFGFALPGLPEMQNRPVLAGGSGFIIDESGIVVTNEHVVRDAGKVMVILRDDDDQKEVEAKLVGIDTKTDLAVLKIDSGDMSLQAVPFGDSDDAQIGDWVVAIGSPLGRLADTVTAGIVSARGRDIGSGPYDDYIQTDAAINRGNSGGPLFNTDGEVIGINTMIISPSGGSIGLGFAIPSNLAASVIDQLLEFGTTRRGWLGVSIQNISSEVAESMGNPELKGALVSEVMPESPAEAAKFKAGDLIIRFDGKAVKSADELPIVVAQTEVNKAVQVVVIRDNKQKTLKVTLGQLEEAENNQAVLANPSNTVTSHDTLLGMELSETNKDIAKRFKLDPNIGGLTVMKVDPKSKAGKIGIRPGDVVLKVNQAKVSTAEEMQDGIEAVRESGRKNVLLFLQTPEGSRFVALPLDG